MSDPIPDEIMREARAIASGIDAAFSIGEPEDVEHDISIPIAFALLDRDKRAADIAEAFMTRLLYHPRDAGPNAKAIARAILTYSEPAHD